MITTRIVQGTEKAIKLKKMNRKTIQSAKKQNDFDSKQLEEQATVLLDHI